MKRLLSLCALSFGLVSLSALADDQEAAGKNYIGHGVVALKQGSPFPNPPHCGYDAQQRAKTIAIQSAQEKCILDGKDKCTLRMARIVKNGELRCEDVPDERCGGIPIFWYS